MSVEVRNALASGWSVLDCNVKTRCTVETLNHPADLLDRQEQIGDLSMIEIRQSLCGPPRRYKYVTRK